MTNEQLYLAIGVPILFNGAMMVIFFTMINRRIDDLIDRVNDLTSRVSRIEDHLMGSKKASNQ